MNCPNCNKKPAGLFYLFRSKDFDFKTRMRGFYKCRNCETLLKQKKTSIGFPSFNVLYYVYSIIFAVLLGIFAYYTFEFLNSQNVSEWIEIATFIIMMGLALTGINFFASRYRDLKEADAIEVEKEPGKLTKTGLAVFLVYMTATIGLFLGAYNYIEMRELGFTLYLALQTLYIVAVFVGAFYLLKIYEKKEVEVSKE